MSAFCTVNRWRQGVAENWRGYTQRHRTRVSAFIKRHRLDHIVHIDQPMVLVSQIQRSGGTMVNGLLDNHSELYVHPMELWIGRRKQFWPELDLTASPKEWFQSLQEYRVLAQAATGYVKPGRPEKIPFMFSLDFQREIFLRVVEEKKPQSQREILNCYVTAYFNAWIDYQGLYRMPKEVKYWSAFAARLAATPGQAAAFFKDYPDGYLISVIRDPESWYASAQKHSVEEYGNIGSAMRLWSESVQVLLDNASQFGNRVLLIDFKDVVRDTQDTMRRVCARIGVKFEPSLLETTFNGWQTPANSSFERGTMGVIMQSTLDRRKHLSEEQRAEIRETSQPVYEKALRQIETAKSGR